MSATQPFSPAYGTGLTISPAVGSATVAMIPGTKQMRVCNIGAAIGFFRTGRSIDGAITATSADMPVPSGISITVTIFQDHDRIATISALGTTFQLIRGEGGAT